jgi:hypothetical protein
MVHQFPEPLGIYLGSENGAELLELTGTIFSAVSAVHRVAGQNKLQSGASQPYSPGALSIDHHTLGNRLCAGSDRAVSSFYFHKAEPAASVRFRSLAYGAQVRYINPVV